MAGTPVLTPPGGAYGDVQSIAVHCNTPSASIHYTTDGREPTEGDPAVVSGDVVLVERSLTLKARAFAPDLLPSNVAGAAYSLQVAKPSLHPGGGLYTAPQQVVLSTGTPDAAIHYTIDGSEPTLGSPRYTAPLTIDRGTVLTARAFREGWLESQAGFATYSFDFGVLEPPVFNPPAGIYVSLPHHGQRSTTPPTGAIPRQSRASTSVLSRSSRRRR
jgi:hypothetical protein